MKTLSFLVLVCTLALPALADDRPDHFEGEPAETLEQALANFNEYNTQLEALVSQDELSAQQMHEVHQLTYTLENALEKIREEYAELAEVLEEVHIASETADPDTVKSRGEAYLDTARRIAP